MSNRYAAEAAIAVEAVRRAAAECIAAAPGAALDYVAVVDADTLEPLARLRGNVLIAAAAKFGTTRLIDNVLLADVGNGSPTS